MGDNSRTWKSLEMETLKSDFPDNAVLYTPSEDDAPTFDELREDGCMLIDDSTQRLAVYPGGGGNVILMEESFDSSVRHIVIDEAVVPSLIAALTKARTEAAEAWAEAEREIELHEAAEAEILAKRWR